MRTPLSLASGLALSSASQSWQAFISSGVNSTRMMRSSQSDREDRIIRVEFTPDEMKACQDWLALDKASPDAKESGVLMTKTGESGDQLYQADVKICNGDTGPWGEIVLFDGRGNEVAMTQPFEALVEAYTDFEV